MGRIAAGDKEARAPISGPQEIRWLAGRFNHMLDGMAERDGVLPRERARQRSLENELRQSEKYALVGRLASGVAHELGTPLSVIDGYAQRLIRRKRAGSEEHETLARVRESTARMAAIVQRLLGFGRESAAAATWISVPRLVSLATADVRTQIDETRTDVECAEGPPDAYVHGDEGRLREALVHLLRNALYAAGGGRIRLGWTLTEDVTGVFVENSGEPLSAHDRERIFEPFFTTKAPGDGSGLGLAIGKGIVVDHNAEIIVYDSRLGGAGFRIEFPRGNEASA